jgi:pSer/pThr/pTyr-binding forkhead associated (FHA) protein
MYGELIPIGGGDPIPLLKSNLMIGRRESSDIVLRFGNVSGQHCELTLDRGWWFVKDMSSQNGTRVNGLRVARKRLDPGDRLTIARHDYEVRYSPAANGGDESQPPEDDVFADIMGRSLLETAGLDRRKLHEREGRIGVRRRSTGGAAQAANASLESADASDERSSGESTVIEPPLSRTDEPSTEAAAGNSIPASESPT